MNSSKRCWDKTTGAGGTTGAAGAGSGVVGGGGGELGELLGFFARFAEELPVESPTGLA